MNPYFVHGRAACLLIALAFTAAGAATAKTADSVRSVIASTSAKAGLSISPDVLNFNTGDIGTARLNSFTVTNSGSAPLTVLKITPLSENNDYRILTPEIPFVLSAGQSVNVSIELFAHDTGCRQESVVVAAESESDTILLRQCTTIGSHNPELDTLYNLTFPVTDVNSCTQQSIEIKVPEETAVYGIYPQHSGNSYFHSLPATPYGGLLLSTLRFEFCPTSEGAFSNRFRCVTSQGIFTVETEGRTPQQVRATLHSYYLDTVTGSVGNTVTLQLTAEPPLTEEDLVDSITLTLDFEKKALVLDKIQSPEFPAAAGILLQRKLLESGATQIILRSSDGFLSGERLLLLHFIGLSTGQPANVVKLEGSTSTESDTAFSDGLIYLEGCTVGASGFSRRVAVESLSIDPSGTHVILRYTSPNGAVGKVAVLNSSGAETLRLELESGTGAPQELRLPLKDFVPGLYGLLLQVADDRVILPFISPR